MLNVGTMFQRTLNTVVDWHRVWSPPPAQPNASIDNLLDKALTAGPIREVTDLIDCAHQFRRHSIFNTRLIRLQRPGARVVATFPEWIATGRSVRRDAIPIIILWPFAPVIAVYDVEDTDPKIDRAAIGDPFAAVSPLTEQEIERAIHRLRRSMAKDARFRVEIAARPLGFALAGKVVAVPGPIDGAAFISSVDELAHSEAIDAVNVAGEDEPQRWIPHYRVTIGERLTAHEQLVTLVHEAGHILCGHLGPCQGDASGHGGWPDRSSLDTSLKEIEAEAVAWLVATRAGIVTGSAHYLHHYVPKADTGQISVPLVERAASWVEQAAKLNYALPGPRPSPL